MAYRSPARWIAPLALVAAVVAILLVVKGAKSHHHGRSGGSRTTTTAAHGGTFGHRRLVYVVRPGDILSAVAQRTGVSVQQIQQLNPNIDANSLHPGQKLKLAAGAP
jgi:LysM repeat protein